LKGITVYKQDDLHDVAHLKLTLNDARSRFDETNLTSRPTVNGLVKLFAGFINVCHPDYNHVLSVINRHNLPLGATIEFDEKCQQPPERDK